ncbi:hypothetical protein [Actinoplanes sp. NPDC049316]|uniref:hypothetical protein n=1 Tax=Actinoplanes sp. NPDC049316 TaxID=3154727 RepID=UPI003421B23F
MTGDAPHPGETPRTEGNPWSWADADTGAWWRADTAPATGTREATAAMPVPPRKRPAPKAAAAEGETKTETACKPETASKPETAKPEAGPKPGTAPKAETAAKPETAPKPAWPPAAGTRTPTPKPAAAPKPATPEPAGESAAAREAGAQDATAFFQVPAYLADRAAEPETTQAETAAAQAAIVAAEAGDAEPEDRAAKGVERSHDEVDAARFNAEGTTTRYAARQDEAAKTQKAENDQKAEEAQDPQDPRKVREEAGEADGAEDLGRAAAVPDVMILPEPQRNRPTVVLDRAAVPGQASGRPRPARTPQDVARADRELQERVRAERTSALLETSPFWLEEHERPAEPAQVRVPVAPRQSRKRGREPRRPAGGLMALLTLALVAAFFSWVSAEPFWLAVGHGDQGEATVSRCTGSGVTQRCVGDFAAGNGQYIVKHVALVGVEPGQTTAPARMVSSGSAQAYVGDTGPLVHLRWSLGFVLVLLCGLGIAGLTGVRRLESRPKRRTALLLSLAGPLALLAGFLVAAY